MVDSKRLRELRGNRSRRQVALSVEITEETLFALETEPKSNPTTRVLAGLADYYGCPVDYLLGRSEAKEKR